MRINGIPAEQRKAIRAMLRDGDIEATEAEIESYRAHIRAANSKLHAMEQERAAEARKRRGKRIKDTWHMNGWQITAHLRDWHPGMRPLEAACLLTGIRGERHSDHHRLLGPALGHYHPDLERLIELELLNDLQSHNPPRRGKGRTAGAAD